MFQIPFTNFVRTSEGAMSQFQLTLAKEYIRSVGISLLTGNSSVEGGYELGIDSIRLVNEEDMAQDLDGALAGVYPPLLPFTLDVAHMNNGYRREETR